MSKVRGHNDGTNLIVNYLPQTVDEEELSGLFSECGMIEAVKVIRDGKSQISRGFAFVKFVDRESAEKAMKKYTGYKMGKKTLRVSLSRPAGEETRETNILIENIPETWDDSELYEQFSVYGQIITHRVVMNLMGSSKGRAYVRYNLKLEAEDAITALNGINIGGSADLIVRFADPPVVKATPELISKKNTRSATQPYPSPARAAREPPYSMMPHLRDAARDPYSDHHHRLEGPPSRPMMGRMGGPQRPLGGGRDKLLSHSAHAAVPKEETWSSSQIPPHRESYRADFARQVPSHDARQVPSHDARQVPSHDDSSWSNFVSPSPERIAQNHGSSYDHEKGWCVFVYNLPQTATNETLYQLFSKFGAINSVKPVVNERVSNNKCKGYGFVHMVNYDDACRSIQSLDSTTFQGKVLQVRFKNAKK